MWTEPTWLLPASTGGHLEVPHRHVEEVDGDEQALGVFIANSRSRRARLAPERIAELSELGMPWE
ncbi:helicase associated domain-containing protein [Streptomyces sp. NPDC047972]|uniref:helicase associated domain-containing protein n=1 Tax=Streptomyces sp. NPDC047972 TaxID=3365493 RepID=UPI003713F028